MKRYNPQTLLVIAPHPDDEAIGCGGLIMQARAWQWQTHVLYMSVGSSRQLVTGSTSAKTRIPEIKKAAKLGNFSYTLAFTGKAFMRLDSLPQKNLIEIIEDTIQKIKPNIICYPYLSSYDQDHRAVATAAITALRPVPKNLRHSPTTILMYGEPYVWDVGGHFVPNFYVDISELLEQKIQLLNCHATQMRKDPFPRSIDNLTRLAGHWGTQIGVQHAEAYQLMKGTLSS